MSKMEVRIVYEENTKSLESSVNKTISDMSQRGYNLVDYIPVKGNGAGFTAHLIFKMTLITYAKESTISTQSVADAMEKFQKEYMNKPYESKPRNAYDISKYPKSNKGGYDVNKRW